jgi:hypothetical protein
LTPTLTAGTVSGWGVEYSFRVSTSPQMDSVVFTTGWISSNSYMVPAGYLKDGRVYWWKVQTHFAGQPGWRASPECSQVSCVNRFEVDLNLAADGSIPSDRHSGVGVNLLLVGLPGCRSRGTVGSHRRLGCQRNM